MKSTYKFLSAITMNGLLCLCVALSANAQHRGAVGSSSSGGGSNSNSSSNSGGGRSSAPSYSPPPSSNNVSRPSVSNNNVSRPSSNNVGYSRPSSNNGGYNHPNNNSRVAIAPQHFNNQGNRTSSYGIAPRSNPGAVTYGGRSYVGTTTHSYVNPSSRSYVGTRGYIGVGGRESVGVGGRGFYSTPSYTYWDRHNYYHYYHGYYGTYYAPRLGFSIGYLPYDYYPFYYGDYQYYYSGGLFYTYNNNTYTVVEPPVGAEVNSLPSNAQSIVINGEQYYEANGVYYAPVTKDDGSITYEVAGKDGQLNTNVNDGEPLAPRIGDWVESLPSDCRKIKLNGEKYYVSPDGYYYQEAFDANHNKVYRIVGTPDDGPQN